MPFADPSSCERVLRVGGFREQMHGGCPDRPLGHRKRENCCRGQCRSQNRGGRRNVRGWDKDQALAEVTEDLRFLRWHGAVAYQAAGGGLSCAD